MQDNHDSNKDQGRRRILKLLVASGGAVTTTRIIPEQWKAPVVNAVNVPVHAELSVIQGLFDTGPGAINPEASLDSPLNDGDQTRVADNQWHDADSSVLDYFLSPATAQDAIVIEGPSCFNVFSSMQISIGIPANPGPGQICIDTGCDVYEGNTTVNGALLTNASVGPFDLSNMQLSGGSVMGNIQANVFKLPCFANFNAPLIPGMYSCNPGNFNCTISIGLSESG